MDKVIWIFRINKVHSFVSVHGRTEVWLLLLKNDLAGSANEIKSLLSEEKVIKLNR